MRLGGLAAGLASYDEVNNERASTVQSAPTEQICNVGRVTQLAQTCVGHLRTSALGRGALLVVVVTVAAR